MPRSCNTLLQTEKHETVVNAKKQTYPAFYPFEQIYDESTSAVVWLQTK